MSPEASALMRCVRRLVTDAMKAEGLSIDDLAEGTGCSSQTIVRLLRGENLTLATLARLAAGLGRRVDIRLVEEKPISHHDTGGGRVSL
ncbi:MAG TPA: helix-turn-helix transcriptional regulator [Gemmatimonadaceae bacterium]|nr:helix-turn-helix transcriptional regulator [Gemmatimonadaceae bacterium]